MHIGMIVTTKEATNLIGTATGLRERGVDAHLHKAHIGEQVLNGFCFCSGRSVLLPCSLINENMIHYCAGVIHVNHRLLIDCCIVSTTIGIHDGTAVYLKIGLFLFWSYEGCRAPRYDGIVFLDDIVVTITQGITLLIGVFEVTVTATEELTDINFLSIRSGFYVSGTFTVGCSL